jgi:hypothetical protein
LLGESLDYAGLFPPAELSLKEALHNYLDYQHHPQAWMLARFVCPITRLAELNGLLARHSPGGQVRLSVLGRMHRGGETPLGGFESDLNAIAALCAAQRERVRIEFYETPLPIDCSADDRVALAAFLTRTGEQFRSAELAPLSVFFEARSWGELEAALANSAEAFPGRSNRHVRFGWKVRLGGADSCGMPTAGDLAHFIAACRDAGCAWKATAGLHQPLGGWNREQGAFRFGFLTLLAAATLAQVHDLQPGTIQQILEEREIARFRFDADAFEWRAFSATGPQVVAARARSLASFGSCSFEEPLEGLRELNQLEGIASHA